PLRWAPPDWAKPLSVMVSVEIEGRDVWVRPWLYVHQSSVGKSVPVILLDTFLHQNAVGDRNITDNLYGGDAAYRLKQEIVLGIGGVRALQALGLQISTYHLNEGHAALLPVELLRRLRRPASRNRSGRPSYDVERIRDLCVFTTHTPVEAGHDRFPHELVSKVAGELIPPDDLKVLGGERELNLTQLALNLSGYVNGVARQHATTTRGMFPGYDIRSVTNGVHAETWTHPAFAALYEKHHPNWMRDPEILLQADRLEDEAVWQAHRQAKADLGRLVREVASVELDPDMPTIGFARRMTAYKRPEMLFSDLARLGRIAERLPFQVVIAGKAHPRDSHGKQSIRFIHDCIRRLDDKPRVVFLPNYALDVARVLVAGCDIWLNTPLPPMEASGTSGMKAALNGVLNLSTLDGWWVEGCLEGATGWGISAAGASTTTEADALYLKLSEVVLPLYYQDRQRWIWMMKQAISKIGSYFNSHRMMRRYAAEAYIR
ncbi:MAG: alpha-glucan family phosphorylase, partial [Acetobacterales bacterium]